MGQRAGRAVLLLLAGLLGEARAGFPNTISIGKRSAAPSRAGLRGEPGRGPRPPPGAVHGGPRDALRPPLGDAGFAPRSPCSCGIAP